LSANFSRQDSSRQASSSTQGLVVEKETIVEIDVRTQDQVKIVKLKGRLNLGPALDRTNETIVDLLNAGETHFVLDLEDVPTIDSSGIGLLVRHMTMAKQRGGSLKLLKPSKFALQTLKLVRVLNLFEVFDELQAAVESFQR
jgi:anti-anti-sigma factor